jgi:hypothetical protein
MFQRYREAKGGKHYQWHSGNCDEKPDRTEGKTNYPAQKTPNLSGAAVCPRKRDPRKERPLDTSEVQQSARPTLSWRNRQVKEDSAAPEQPADCVREQEKHHKINGKRTGTILQWSHTRASHSIWQIRIGVAFSGSTFCVYRDLMAAKSKRVIIRRSRSRVENTS